MLKTRTIQAALKLASVNQRENLLRLTAESLGIGQTNIKSEVYNFVKLLNAHNPNPLILDIGANSGDWSLELKNKIPNARIDLFEPVKHHHGKLLAMIESGALTNSHLCKYGISAKGGPLKIFSPSVGSGAASIVEVDNPDYIYTEIIETQTLHSTIESRPDCEGIKIDIEGAEFEILNNSAGAIASSKIRVIQFEFGEKTTLLKQNFKMFFDYFKELDFDLHRASGKELIPIKQWSMWNEVHVNTVIFATKKSKFGKVDEKITKGLNSKFTNSNTESDKHG
jgi:FkbM family methyltransferase